jgi:hypothetical protein
MLNPKYWDILKARGGEKMSIHVGGIGYSSELSKPIIDFLKENNKRFKEQQEKREIKHDKG